MRPKSLFILDTDALELVYGPAEYAAILERVDLIAPPLTQKTLAAHRNLLAHVELLFSGWGSPLIDEEFLAAAPKLKAIFYAAGAIGHWCTEAVWDRGIVVVTANDANAIPVAEYTLSSILFSLKQGWSLARRTREEQFFPDRNIAPGAYETTVGLVSLGMIGRKVVELLKPFKLKVIAYDPFVSDEDAAAMGVELVSLNRLFKTCDVISVHTPYLPETEGMITGEHFESMKPQATFINTSRGSLVREAEMLEVLSRRTDLQAVLDTTEIEPPPKGSLLYTLPNIFLTPHIAGSVGNECRRMAHYMIEDLDHYLRGEPLRWQVHKHHVANSVHRPVAKVRRSAVSVPASPTSLT